MPISLQIFWSKVNKKVMSNRVQSYLDFHLLSHRELGFGNKHSTIDAPAKPEEGLWNN